MLFLIRRRSGDYVSNSELAKLSFARGAFPPILGYYIGSAALLAVRGWTVMSVTGGSIRFRKRAHVQTCIVLSTLPPAPTATNPPPLPSRPPTMGGMSGRSLAIWGRLHERNTLEGDPGSPALCMSTLLGSISAVAPFSMSRLLRKPRE